MSSSGGRDDGEGARWAHRAFVALGSNAGDPVARLTRALQHLHDAGERIAAVAPATWTPFERADGRPQANVPRVLNTVVELATSRPPEALLALLGEVEAKEGRDRSAEPERTLDLDLLAHGPPRSGVALELPHPRALARAFVLAPWEEIAPLFLVPGTKRPVVAHAARLRTTRPEAFDRLTAHGLLDLPDARGSCEVLESAAALEAWRASCHGIVGVVPTMGALHAGHEALLRRARAECDAVLVTLFVNPLQFGADEDLDRYPQTLAEDLALLRRTGTDAVYAPRADDLYPEGFGTYVLPEGPARGLEGAARPGHFRGVATVVYLLWRRTRPDRAYFGRKDAQQLAVVRRMVRDLELGGHVVACPTVRDHDGLALSSRNRYLSSAERERAVALRGVLNAMAVSAARGEEDESRRLEAEGRARLEAAGLEVDYLQIVNPDTMEPAPLGDEPALAVAAVRVGRTRLLDNRWLVRPGGEASR